MSNHYNPVPPTVRRMQCLELFKKLAGSLTFPPLPLLMGCRGYRKFLILQMLVGDIWCYLDGKITM